MNIIISPHAATLHMIGLAKHSIVSFRFLIKYIINPILRQVSIIPFVSGAILFPIPWSELLVINSILYGKKKKAVIPRYLAAKSTKTFFASYIVVSH